MAALVPTTRLLASVLREAALVKFPVQRSRVVAIVVPDAVATVTTTETVNLNGLLTAIRTAAPAIPTDTTFDVALLDEDGLVVASETGIADASNVFTKVADDLIYLVGEYTVNITNASPN